MFVDLVGSTELAARLDPEDMSALIRAYQNTVAGEITRFEGHVAKYMGDGVLAYFGWPRAHEDEAERAVRAGLAIGDALVHLETSAGETLAARIGIATGSVVVGELIGDGAAQEQAVVGETPNLAARLQALAEPGSVVIGAATRRLLGGLFELDDLGPKRLKGFAEPLAAFRVAGEGGAEDRFEARQAAGLTPLVGREEEISLLLRRWRQATEGEGQVVLLSGEPGIGKSRLVREVRERLADEPHLRLLYQCSPHHTTSPLHPLIEQLERSAGFARDDPPDLRLAKLETLLARGTDRLDQAVPLIAALLGLPTDDRYPPLDLTPQRRKQLTLEALVDQLDGLTAAKPVLLAYEDVHWIDPTTQDLLGLTIERIQHLPVLALITFRPEFQPPWPGQPHVSTLALTRLGRREGAALVERVVRDKALPDEVAAQIVAKTDGVPLFVEELTKTVLEFGPAAPMRAITTSFPAPCRRSPYRQRSTTPCSPGSIASRRSRRWPRSAPLSAASSLTRCSPRSPTGRRRSSRPPSTSWSHPSWCSTAVSRPRRSTASSTPWSRMQPTAPCSGPAASNSTPASPK